MAQVRLDQLYSIVGNIRKIDLDIKQDVVMVQVCDNDTILREKQEYVTFKHERGKVKLCISGDDIISITLYPDVKLK